MSQNLKQTELMIPTWVNGELVPVEKLHAHEKGLKHKAISVFVMNGNKTLLQRRALAKYHTPGMWTNSCCTHPHWNENTYACAQRRLSEELGIENLSPVYRDTVEYRADVGNGLIEHEVVDIFVAQAPKQLSITPNPNEVMDTQWVTLTALHKMVQEKPDTFTPWLRIYLDQHWEIISQ